MGETVKGRLRPERILVRLADFAVRHPRRVLAIAVTAALVAVAAAALHLELRTSNLDLIDPELPTVRRFVDFAEEFGTPNALIVVLEGDDPAALRAAVDRVAPRLAELPGVRGAFGRLPLDPDALDILGVDPYLHSRDDGMYFLFIHPDDPRSNADTIAPFVAGVRRVLDGAGLAERGVHAGLTGMPAYALDDRDVIQRDVSSLSLVALALVAFLFAAAFGSFRRPLLAVASLLLAVAVTLGVVALHPGHLTLLSAFFASILFGLGVDYGIHLVDRVEEEVAAGAAEASAVTRAVTALAPGLWTSAATSASVLFAMRFSGFRGFAELGVIAAAGILCCLLAMVTVLPALLVLRPPSRRRERRLGERRLGRLLARLQSRPAAALLGAGAVFAAFAGGPGFDSDYLNLQPRGSETVRLEREMVRRSDLSPEMVAFTAGDRDELGDLLWRLADDETVGSVRSIRDLEVFGVVPAVDPAFLAGFRSDAGRYAVYAYPREDVWRPEAQETFLAHMRAIDPEVTGLPVLGRFMVDRSRRALVVTSTLGAALLAVWVLADFRRPLPALLAALPAVLTATGLHALMKLFGVPWNPLDVMALPVVLGIAVDDGVHLVHRFLAEGGDLRRTLAGTGRSIVLTSATTVAAFGALAFTSHRGLASFAVALTLGVVTALLLTVLMLPQLLRRLSPWVLAPTRPCPRGDVSARSPGGWHRGSSCAAGKPRG